MLSHDFSFVQSYVNSPYRGAVALTILALAGICFTTEHVIVDALNGKNKKTLLFTALLSALSFIVSVVVWFSFTYILLALFVDAPYSARIFMVVAALAFVPAIILPFGVMPYIGIILNLVIYAWITYLMGKALHATFQQPLLLVMWPALFSYIFVRSAQQLFRKITHQETRPSLAQFAEAKVREIL